MVWHDFVRRRQTARRERPRLRPRVRVGLGVAAMGLVALLVVAAQVEPDPRGYGTHRRFGLPPCSFHMVSGRPCPTCGMTTAWACLVRGRIVAAVKANAGGMLMGLAAAIGAVWMALSATRGQWWIGRPEPEHIGIASIAIGGVILLQWAVRLIGG